jgi:hypothetical protein
MFTVDLHIADLANTLTQTILHNFAAMQMPQYNFTCSSFVGSLDPLELKIKISLVYILNFIRSMSSKQRKIKHKQHR